MVAGDVASMAVNLTGPQTVYIDGINVTVGSLELRDTASTYRAFTIAASNSGSLTFSNPGTNSVLSVGGSASTISAPISLTSTLSVTNAVQLTLSGTIGGLGGLIKDGGATLVISNAMNTFSGTTKVVSGTLQVSLGSQTGTNQVLGTGPIELAGGTLHLRNGSASSSEVILGNDVAVTGTSTIGTSRTGSNNEVKFTFDELILGANQLTLTPRMTMTSASREPRR
jgi:autotransporter-associated beta strand protein